MKKNITATFGFVLLIALCYGSRPVHADIGDAGASARAIGMGEAFVAVADDASALHYNPAGLNQLSSIALTTQYDKLMMGLDDRSIVQTSHLGYAQPMLGQRKRAWGVSFDQFKGSEFFSDRVINIGMATEIPLSKRTKDQFSMGVGIKQWQRQYNGNAYTANAVNNGVATGQSDPLFSSHGTSKETYALDTGFLYQFGRGSHFSIGGSLININRPDRSLAGDGDRAPFQARVGTAFRTSKTIFSGEFRRVEQYSGLTDHGWALGAEHSVTVTKNGALSFRAGYEQGSRDYQAVSVGLSVRIYQIQLDYALNLPIGMGESIQNQHLNLTLRFSLPQKDSTSLSLSSRLPTSAAEESFAADYQNDVKHYYERKAAGASMEERLYKLQGLIMRYSQSKNDLSWTYKELSAL